MAEEAAEIEALLRDLKPGEAFLWEGDCREFLARLPDRCVDAVVTDPPYELGFMGQAWDRTGIAFDPAFWAEVLRVLKPGGHLLAAGIGRTHHRMMAAVEDAGFEIRDCIYHIFGSGFPKNLDVSKAIGKLKGAEEAAKWEGFGTALKPSVEIYVLARKPLSEASVAENVLKWGTGALNVDGCRIGENAGWRYPNGRGGRGWGGRESLGRNLRQPVAAAKGRWPANLVLSHSEECAFKGYKRIRGSGTSKIFHGPYDGVSATGFLRGWSHPGNQHADPDGTELIEDWECAPGCPVRALDEQSGELRSGLLRAGTVRSNLCGCRGAMPAAVLRDTYGDSGGASRFFYCAKVSRPERWGFCRECGRAVPPEELVACRGRGHEVAVHPTQKPLQLMRWLVRLVTPPGGLVLDPFAGSGTTLVAAVLEGFRALGCERDPEYAAVARARIAAAAGRGWEEDDKSRPGAGVPRQARIIFD